MWKEGNITVNKSNFYYCALVFDEPSQYGIRKGRISKLNLIRNDEEVLNYDRGWDTRPVDEDTKSALKILLAEYK